MSILQLVDVEMDRDDYKGRPTTLCAGCGHNSISNQIVSVAYDMKLNPHHIIKLSGIGCSSKSPAYFLSRSHGFNSLHGRMPSIGTGAVTVNRQLKAVGVSGDGDSGSIGMGQFKHVVRRNVPMVYIIENNGVYGLTKGQFSATADYKQELKYAGTNELMPVDFCLEAMATGASFVARSFAGDAKQVRELLKAAMSHNGIAILDIISPCVTFNNHETSTKSYPYGRDHAEPLQDLTYIPHYEEITVHDHKPGEDRDVELHDGSTIHLHKLDPDAHDPTDFVAAMKMLQEAYLEQKFITGLIYLDKDKPAFQEVEHLVDTPLVHLSEEDLRPPKKTLDSIMEQLKCQGDC